MVGLVKPGFATGELADAGGNGVGELPADGRLGSRTRSGHLDKRIARSVGEVAGQHHIGLRVAERGRTRAGRRGIPADFVEPGIKRGRFNLVGPLPLDGNQHARSDVGLRTRGGKGDALPERDGDIALGIGRPGVADCRQRCSIAEIRAVHHQVVANLGVETGRTAEDECAAAHGRGIPHLAEGADDHTVRETRIPHRGGGTRVRINRRQCGGAGNRHGDLVVKMLLEKARGRDGVVGDAVLPDDLRGHHDDRRDGGQQQPGDRKRRKHLHQGEAPVPAGEWGGEDYVGKSHGTVRATMMLCD